MPHAGGDGPGDELAAGGTAAGTEPGGACSESLALETEWVEVSRELSFTWHRPPLETVEQQWRDPGTVRIFLNGCFDLMHVGHFNALRQAKSLFFRKGYRRVVLVAGIHSDAAIAGQKGPPLMSNEERLAVLRATKWVDELATELPYVSMSASMADALRVHFICHGDDLPVCRGGGGMYTEAMEAGRFQLVKRTEGISTTHILERLLRGGEVGAGAAAAGALGATLATTQRLADFAAPAEPQRPRRLLAEAQRVVYVRGSFDLLHGGHVALLEHAAQLGDYLLVGLLSDEAARRRRGAAPVLTLPERAMAVLSLRAVDDVVLGAPEDVGSELLAALNVALVATGQRPGEAGEARDDGLALPRSLGILRELERAGPLTSQGLRQRFLSRSAEFTERNAGLLEKELAYVRAKSYVPEA